MVNVVRIKEVEENVVLRKADFENLIGVVESLMDFSVIYNFIYLCRLFFLRCKSFI